MRVTSYLRDGRLQPVQLDALTPLCDELRVQLPALSRLSVHTLLELLECFAQAISRDARTATIEGLGFLATWLRRSSLEAMLQLNLHGELGYLDGFCAHGSRGYLRAQATGLVCQWLAGNVGTLVFFSLIPSLLAKNPTLVKLALADPPETLALLQVLSEVQVPGLSGAELLRAVGVVYFPYQERDLNEQMSLAADCRVAWGSKAAVQAITGLPRQEHCTELIFGPKYSIGVLGAGTCADPGRLQALAQAMARDIIVFDQRACSSPQTVFVEGDMAAARQVAEALAKELARLPRKQALDAYTAVRIMNTRARYGMDPSCDLLQSERDNDWTLCLDPKVELKEAIQSRTLFLVPVGDWREIVPLLHPGVQTVGIAFAEERQALAFADQATLRGVARCVRFGLMNVNESPWDGKLMVSRLVRWVTCKP